MQEPYGATDVLGVLFVTAVGAALLSGCAGMTVDTTWSPDSKYVAYGSGENKLSIYDVATKQSQETTVGGEVGTPSWSPDGKLIAFYAVNDKTAHVDLQAMDTASGQVRTLAGGLFKPAPKTAKPKPSKPEDNQEPGFATFYVTGTISWSPDSTRLICTTSSANETGALLVEVAAGPAKPILRGRHTILTMSWAPDGRKIAYLQTPSTPAEIEDQWNANSTTPAKAEPDCSLFAYDVRDRRIGEGVQFPGARVRPGRAAGVVGGLGGDWLPQGRSALSRTRDRMRHRRQGGRDHARSRARHHHRRGVGAGVAGISVYGGPRGRPGCAHLPRRRASRAQRARGDTHDDRGQERPHRLR